MMIVITPEKDYSEESTWVIRLLEEELPLLHIRKYAYSDSEMQTYIHAIPEKYREQLVLHSHYHLAEGFGINRLHVQETLRDAMGRPPEDKDLIWSTSTHSMKAFNALPSCWSYAFLSPMFPSISKPGHGGTQGLYDSLCERVNMDVKLTALGGMLPEYIPKVVRAGADGIATLGGIWESDHPLRAYKTYQERYRLAKAITA